MGATVISMKDVTRVYKMGDTEEHALRGISFNITQGEFVAIMGPSGSGKSTCMNMIGCLDRPTSGIVEIDGRPTEKMSEKELAVLRNKTVGFVFQQYHLIPSLTIVENVMLPLRYQKIEKSERLPLAEAALEKVALVGKMNFRPHELSGGQKQRVAIARALVTRPKIILADEPTGALDSETGKQIMALFNEINAGGTTIVIVTHDPRIGAAIRRCIHIFDGKIKADVTQTPVPFTGDSPDSAEKPRILAQPQRAQAVQAQPRRAPVQPQRQPAPVGQVRPPVVQPKPAQVPPMHPMQPQPAQVRPPVAPAQSSAQAVQPQQQVVQQRAQKQMPDLATLPPAARNAYLNGTIK
ncbi:MAG: ATP-binding cassette domain-containing protein [Spirochaetaceae bacterium]|nr:ATP-binding cassette domain-containing protein [Spirochaetaceae bacterium]